MTVQGIPDTVVWLVEDDESYRSTLSYVIGNSDRCVLGAQFGDCESAIEEARSGGLADVILLDINLPGLNGIEGLTKLKELLPNSQIIMLTIIDDPGRIFDALAAGASGYLLKNSSVDQIVGAVYQAALGGTLMPPGVADKVLGFFRKSTDGDGYRLTPREQEVLETMGEGLSHKEIAEKLFVSPHTIDTHIQHIYEKLHVRSGIEAVAKALREGLIE